jgi:Ribbon-helix-helix protein, copG family
VRAAAARVQTVDMARVRTEIELDEGVLRQAQAAAEGSGRSRDDVIEEALRAQLAGRALDTVLRRVRERSNLSTEEALKLAYSERDAGRVERRLPPSRDVTE